MDRKLQENPEIQRLIRLSAAARGCLESEVNTFRQRIDVPSRLRESLKHHPTGWLFGSLAAGLTTSLLFRRRPSEKKHRGIPATLLGLTLTAARPLAKVWLTDQVKNWVARQSSTSQQYRTYTTTDQKSS
jgi:hypothetical protein